MNDIQSTKKRRSIDPRMIIGVLAGLYGLSPIDAMPDFIPVLGQADDAFVILLAVALILFLGMGNDEGGN